MTTFISLDGETEHELRIIYRTLMQTDPEHVRNTLKIEKFADFVVEMAKYGASQVLKARKSRSR